MMNFEAKIENGYYIVDFFNDTYFYRELCEDYLYVLLNINLSYTILKNAKLKEYIKYDKSSLFEDELKLVFKNHYNKYVEGYKCLNQLREYSFNNCLSLNQIEDEVYL